MAASPEEEEDVEVGALEEGVPSSVAVGASKDSWEWEDADEDVEVAAVTEPSEDDVYTDAGAVDSSMRDDAERSSDSDTWRRGFPN